MKKAIFILFFIPLVISLSIHEINNHEASNENKNVIHFIKTGNSDSILIESNGHYGLIDSSKPYKYIENEVEHVEINGTDGEKNHWIKDPDQSVQAVINYLNYKKIDKLDFIISTHSHSDHIGGIPAIAYYFVNKKTKYYYRKYRKTKEDITKISMASYKYYLAAVHSMQKKSAQMIDVTNQDYKFNFFDLSFELLNTDIDSDELKYGENQNSIVTLITFKNKKILLASDMISKDDKKLKDYINKIDILKLSHHGKSESSYDFLKTVQPNYVIVTNKKVPEYLNQIINFLKYRLGSKIYLTEYVSKSSESFENSAIKLNLKQDEPEYEFNNTGKEVDIDSSINGWFNWCDKKTYLDSGITVKGFNYLEWEGGKDWFYFNEDGIMLIGWQELEKENNLHWFYFDKINGNMLTGWQELEWSEGNNMFYFYPEKGYMAQDCCIDIDENNYCFDKNGCLIK